MTEVLCTRCGEPTLKYPRHIKEENFCSTFCSNNYRAKVREHKPNYKDGSTSYRALAFANLPNECSVCQYNIIEVLEVHHKDRNRKNNKIENLDILCPTHHVEYEVGLRSY